MSTVASPSGSAKSLENLLLDYQEGVVTVVILRSQDSYEFRVPKFHLIHNSPVFREELPIPQPDDSVICAEPDVGGSTGAADAHQLVHFPFNGAILTSLLSYIFPVPPILPSTTEEIMELLSAAEMYKMDVVLTHIRNRIAQQQPPLIRKETALSVYTLAQKHGLCTEALEAARCTLSFLAVDFYTLSEEDELGLMPGALLHELWNYHNRFLSNLKTDMEEFETSRPKWIEILGDTSGCDSLTDSGLPRWISFYFNHSWDSPAPIAFDFTDFYLNLVYHCPERYTKRGDDGCPSCFDMSDEALHAFWEAFMSVVQGSIAKAEFGFAADVEGTRSENEVQNILPRETPSKHSDMPGADIILQSSDLVNFRVHRSVLATSSPFFRDMLSLPQPSSDTPDLAPDQLPVVHVSETAEILNSLISMLYHVPPEMPYSSDNLLALLAATDKYDMDAVQSSIKKSLSPADSSRVFHMYAVACRKGLITEMEVGARLTLDYPLTLESIGEAMRSFDGGQLRDLYEFRLRCLDKLSSGMKSFSDHQNGPSKIWVGCPEHPSRLPWWINLRGDYYFYNSFPTSAQVREEFSNSFQGHIDKKGCDFCSQVYRLKGEAYCAEMGDVVEQARNVPLLNPGTNVPTPKCVSDNVTILY